MSTHTCQPGHPGVLAADCERCAELANDVLSLDEKKTAALWDLMVSVEMGVPVAGVANDYVNANEGTACSTLYRMGVWLERYAGVDPWVPFADLHKRLKGDAA